ncbi:Receptor mediated endocytosis 8 [Fasciola gigantica]|uniref:Receptor mediated endocytosis 8 n=1 Tax=Fasciola gigantica TaxID=46835 RepID=A0A504X782_FASGI|nr:Receptor mediated endocytosis 8 [Fasciola gigantica]
MPVQCTNFDEGRQTAVFLRLSRTILYFLLCIPQEKFVAATTAYQFLCNRSKLGSGPNRLHIQLMLRAQSIIYNRYRPVLASQKYAGYPMLVTTIRREVEDEELFARVATSEDFSVPRPKDADNEDEKNTKNENAANAVLLVAAAELAYETVATSALNAEELRREGGIQALHVRFFSTPSFSGLIC